MECQATLVTQELVDTLVIAASVVLVVTLVLADTQEAVSQVTVDIQVVV